MNPVLLYAPAIIAPVLGLVAWIWSKHLSHDLEAHFDEKKAAAAASQPEFDLAREVAASKSLAAKLFGDRFTDTGVH